MPGRASSLILVHRGGQTGRQWRLVGAKRLVVGRGPEADIRVDDRTVARRHLVLERTGDGWTARDNGSASGTAVIAENRWQQVETLALDRARTIRLGDAVLRFELEAGDPVRRLLLRLRFFDWPTGAFRIAPLVSQLDAHARWRDTTLTQLLLIEQADRHDYARRHDILAEAVDRVRAALGPGALLGLTHSRGLAALTSSPADRVIGDLRRRLATPFPSDGEPRPITFSIEASEGRAAIGRAARRLRALSPDVRVPGPLAAIRPLRCRGCERPLAYLPADEQLVCPRCGAMFALDPDVFGPVPD